MSKQTTIQALESSIKRAKELVDCGSALERLRTNRDFKKIVVDGYFAEEAIRLVHLKADPAMQSEGSQASIIRQMDAIGSLSDYFRTVDMAANQARRSIQGDEETLEELHAEAITA
jgi:hypothetical protein